MATPFDHIEPIDDIEHLIPDQAKGTCREAEWRAELYAFYDVPQFDKLFMRLALCQLTLRDDMAPDSIRIDISVPRQDIRSSRILNDKSALGDAFNFASVRIGMVMTFSVVHMEAGQDSLICTGSMNAQEGRIEPVLELFPEGSRQSCGSLRLNIIAIQARDFRLYLQDGLFPMAQGADSSAILGIYNRVCSSPPEFVADALHRLSTAEQVDSEGHVFDIGHGQLLKRGFLVIAREAVAMEFVRRRTSIPVPRVYGFFEHKGQGHIIMERMAGTPLSQSMGALAEHRFEIHRQLCAIMLELRRLPCQSALGGWPSGPYNNIDFRYPEPAEPFDSVDDFWLWWHRKRRLDPSPTPPALSSTPGYVLAHADLVPKNVLVEGHTIVAVLDWETFGTYPDCWEAVVVAHQFNPPSDILTDLPGWPASGGGSLCAAIISMLYPLPY